jgi:hypothetical protein
LRRHNRDDRAGGTPPTPPPFTFNPSAMEIKMDIIRKLFNMSSAAYVLHYSHHTGSYSNIGSIKKVDYYGTKYDLVLSNDYGIDGIDGINVDIDENEALIDTGNGTIQIECGGNPSKYQIVFEL